MAMFSGKNMPQEYIDFCLMKFYGCTPQELDEMDDHIVSLHTEFIILDKDKEEIDKKRAAQQLRNEQRLKDKNNI